MSYAAAPPPFGDFQIARVLGRSFDVLSRDFVRFYLIAAVISLPLLVFRRYGWPYLATGTFVPGAGIGIGTLITVLFGGAALLLAFTTLGQAVILYGAVQRMRGRSFGIGESLSRGLARLFPILGMFILYFVAIALPVFALVVLTNLFWSLPLFVLGALASVVVFFLLSARWYVSLPACIIERSGPVASLSRSAFLTESHRWKIFGIYLLLLVAGWLAWWILTAMLVSLFGVLLANFGLFLWQALVGAYQAIVVAIAYHDLRVVKEGIDIERVAEVFD